MVGLEVGGEGARTCKGDGLYQQGNKWSASRKQGGHRSLLPPLQQDSSWFPSSFDRWDANRYKIVKRNRGPRSRRRKAARRRRGKFDGCRWQDPGAIRRGGGCEETG